MTLSNKNIIKTYTIHCTTIKQMSDWLKDNFTKKELDKSKIVFICQDGVSNLELFDKETFQDIVYKEYKYKNCSKKKKFKDKDLQLQGIISWSPEGIQYIVEQFRLQGIKINKIVPDINCLIDYYKLLTRLNENPFVQKREKLVDMFVINSGVKFLLIIMSSGRVPII